jgi:hypothetical protein
MKNVTFIDVEQVDGTSKTFAIIAHEDGSFTSMTKADYDASTLPSNSSDFSQPIGGNE